MGASIPQGRPKRRVPQRAVPQSIRRSGKPLFFGWGAHLTHHEREQVKERIAAAIGIVIALAVIGILGAGAVYQYVVKPAQDAAAHKAAVARQRVLDRQVYATVGGVKITRGWYDAALNTDQQRYKQTITSLGSTNPTAVSQLQQAEQQLPQSELGNMIANVVFEQKGHFLGAKTTSADDSRWLAGQLKQNFHNSLADFDSVAHQHGMTPYQYRQYLLMSLYNGVQMEKVFKSRVATTGFSAHVRHILITASLPLRSNYGTTLEYKAAVKLYNRKTAPQARAKAQMVLRRLEAAGGSTKEWKLLALKYSGDTGSKPKGGDLGWAQTSTYVAPFQHAANTWSIGRIGIVHSQFGFHVMQVLGRKKQKLSPSQIQQNEGTALNTWLNRQEAAKGYVVRKITPSSTGIPGTSPVG